MFIRKDFEYQHGFLNYFMQCFPGCSCAGGSVTPLQIMTSVSPGLMKLLSNCRTGQGVL
nr:Uncharacterised protein [Klebsiella pneumoniae]